MNLLPFENIEIVSPLTEGEIENAIKNNIVWTTDLGMSFTKNSSREYEGFIENGTFKIRRILKSGRNSFIPIVSGTISKGSNNGSKITLKLRLHKLVMILLVAITVFTGILFITPLLSTQEQSKEQMKEYYLEHGIDEQLTEELLSYTKGTSALNRINWTSLLMFIAPYLMTIIFYNYEAKIVKDKMRAILKG